MKEIFKALILEFHESDLPKLVKRELALPVLPKHVRKAFVFMGMRPAGKTWSVYQIMEGLLRGGLEFSKILYINFEDERLAGMQAKNFQDILEAYFELYPSYLNQSDIHFFLMRFMK